MAQIVTEFKGAYIAGETAKLTVEATGCSAVSVIVGADTHALTAGAGGIWSAAISTARLIGRTRWSVMATATDGTVECLGTGAFAVRCAGRSPLRDVIDAIDAAVKTWGTNPNRSISVGEIRIDYKSLDDLLAVRAQYVARAEEQENGRAFTGGLRVVEVNFQ